MRGDLMIKLTICHYQVWTIAITHLQNITKPYLTNNIQGEKEVKTFFN